MSFVTGRYRVYAGEIPYELIEVTAGTHAASILGPIWAGAGTIQGGVYRGLFADLVGGATGHHVARLNTDGSLEVKAFFDGTAEPVRLTWRPEA